MCEDFCLCSDTLLSFIDFGESNTLLTFIDFGDSLEISTYFAESLDRLNVLGVILLSQEFPLKAF